MNMAKQGRDNINARAVLTQNDFNAVSGDVLSSARCLLKTNLDLVYESPIKYLQKALHYIQFKCSLYEYY